MHMKNLGPLAVLLALLVTAGMAAATITAPTVAQEAQLNLAKADAATTTLESVVAVTISADTSIHATLPTQDTIFEDAVGDYQFNLGVSTDDGATYTVVDPADASTAVAVTTLDTIKVRVELVVPADAAKRNIGDHPLSVVWTDTATTPATFAHDVTLRIYDATTDTDADLMADSWEVEHFGSITASDGTGDADRDTYTDLQEHDAGTDPHNNQDYPGATSGGGGSLDENEMGVAVGGLLVFAAIAFVGVYYAGEKAGGKKGFFNYRNEQGLANILGLSALVIFAAFGVIYGLDYASIGGSGWAFWEHAKLSATEFIATGLAAAAVLAAGAYVMLNVKQNKEMPNMIGFLLAAIVVLVGGYIAFGVYDVPVPFA